MPYFSYSNTSHNFHNFWIYFHFSSVSRYKSWMISLMQHSKLVNAKAIAFRIACWMTTTRQNLLSHMFAMDSTWKHLTIKIFEVLTLQWCWQPLLCFASMDNTWKCALEVCGHYLVCSSCSPTSTIRFLHKTKTCDALGNLWRNINKIWTSSSFVMVIRSTCLLIP